MKLGSIGTGLVLVSAFLVISGAPGVLADASAQEQTITVDTSDNIFAAGADQAPSLFGGGGEVPPSVPVGDAETVTFPNVSGEIDAGGSAFPKTGPEGYSPAELPSGAKRTDINSYGGIAGVVHENRTFFLVGVFLTDQAPAPPAPDRLNFTGNDSFERLSPEVGQVFFIGDGRTDDGKLQTFVVPEDATRLYLGIADAGAFQGDPGTYGDNSGDMSVTVSTGSGDGSTPADTTSDGDSTSLPGFSFYAGIAGILGGLFLWRLERDGTGE